MEKIFNEGLRKTKLSLANTLLSHETKGILSC